MSKINITEYSALARAPGGGEAPVGMEPSVASRSYDVGVESASSKNFLRNTNFVRIIAEEDVRVRFSNADLEVVADEDSTLIPAGTSEYFGVSMLARKVAFVRSL